MSGRHGIALADRTFATAVRRAPGSCSSSRSRASARIAEVFVDFLIGFESGVSELRNPLPLVRGRSDQDPHDITEHVFLWLRAASEPRSVPRATSPPRFRRGLLRSDRDGTADRLPDRSGRCFRRPARRRRLKISSVVGDRDETSQLAGTRLFFGDRSDVANGDARILVLHRHPQRRRLLVHACRAGSRSDRAAPRNGHVLRERQDRPIRERNGDRSASQGSFDANGVHHDCTGAPHSWYARAGP